MPSTPTSFAYDVFVSYSHRDSRWVFDELLPQLDSAGLRACVDVNDFQFGAPLPQEIERAVEHSRHTLLVFTPAYLESVWTRYEAHLVQTRDPINDALRFIPIRLEACELPLRFDGFVAPNFKQETDHEALWERLITTLGGKDANERSDPSAIPLPRSLPPGSRMPYPPNPLFVGRHDELRTLAQLLLSGSTAAVGQIAAASGLGGIGKTQLAAEFVHRYGTRFRGGVFWLSMAEAASVAAEVAACGEEMGLDVADRPLDEQVKQVQRLWKQSTPRLLVFDNCEDEALLDQWRPPTGGCLVLVTTRRATWRRSLRVQMLGLGVLPRAESIALLHHHRPDLAADDPILDAIAEAVGDLPLALHLAGSYLDEYRRSVSPQSYLQQLQSPDLLNHPCFQSGEMLPTRHEAHVAQTFALSYDRLNAADPMDALALALLVRAACLAPGEPIPLTLLAATVAEDSAETVTPAVEAALRRLATVGLIDLATGSVQLHRLVWQFVRASAEDGVAQGAVEGALILVANRLNEAGYPAALLPLQGHLRHVIAQAADRNDETLTTLTNSLGYHLNMLGDYASARPLLERALHIREQALGPDHPRTAVSLNNLAELLKAQGDYAAARPLLERALAIRERSLGPDHPDTAQGLNNFAGLLYAQGDYVTARPLYERALLIREQTLGPDHPDTAQSLNNLAILIEDQGDYGAARPLLERALRITEQILGPDHPDTAVSLNNLAGLLYAQGDYVTARPLLERALHITEQALGPDHPDTAQSLNNLAMLIEDQGDYVTARPLLERALTINEQALGPDHPDTATSLNNLAALLESVGDYAAARPLYERALLIGEHALGPDHPDTAGSLNNLALLLQAVGDYATARPLLERALLIREQALGPEHPTTQATQRNLAHLLATIRQTPSEKTPQQIARDSALSGNSAQSQAQNEQNKQED
jgi:tetratricopeptide (TPR) repeat protein